MKQSLLLVLSVLLTLSSCNFLKNENEAIFASVYNDSKLTNQQFSIQPGKDTSLTTANGTTFRIYANTFVTENDSAVTGPIELEIKEALAPIDFVLGNLITVSDGKPLMSGGMIYLDAKSNGQNVKIKEGGEIGCIVPASKFDEGMMIYEGERNSNGMMNWTAPEPILNSTLRTLEQSFITITYSYHADTMDTQNTAFKEWLWQADRKVGDKTKVGDVSVKVVDITKDLVSLKESNNGLFIPEVITNKGKNGFVEDYNTSYIFSIKKLGWANIDKLYEDPKAEEVQMLATISNQQEFDHVFTSLLLPEQKMYIPGYQKKDDSFGFTHDDEEPLILPIGSEAIIMATAYKGDKPYFNSQKIKIGPEMNISFPLNETTPEGLKKALKETI